MDKIDTKEFPIIDSMDYRGYHFDFYLDDYGQSVFTIFNGEEIGFGSYNTEYREDLEYLIDNKLDVITRFPDKEEFFGASLRWFNNGGYDDIKLTYRMRILKIWVLTKERDKIPESTIKKIISESENILSKQGLQK